MWQTDFMKTSKKTTLSCEQVYEIWKNEPDLIAIFDTREKEEYIKFHIPGSRHQSLIQLPYELIALKDKLAIVVADEFEINNIECALKEFENFCIVKNFSQWEKLTQEMPHLKTTVQNEVLEIGCEDVFENLKYLRLIDVRRFDEFTGELGHIEHAELISLGKDLACFLEKADKNQIMVFICRSGVRSLQATKESKLLGFKHTYNMIGGMLKWNELKFPVFQS